jgi:chaperone required for assembly of F1-ATPase
MRFYKEVKIIQRDGGYAVELDGQLVLTPGGKPQTVASKALVEAIAAEWCAQGKKVIPATMPLTGYVNTAIDRIGNNREVIFKNVLNFAGTDLLCYRCEEPEDLATRQNEYWQPLLDWAADSMGVELEVTHSILPLRQPIKAIEALVHKLQKMNDMEIAGIASLAAACGSLIIALALADGKIDPAHAFDCSQLDQIYQNERWGVDEEAKSRQKNIKNDIASAALFLSLLGS